MQQVLQNQLQQQLDLKVSLCDTVMLMTASNQLKENDKIFPNATALSLTYVTTNADLLIRSQRALTQLVVLSTDTPLIIILQF